MFKIGDKIRVLSEKESNIDNWSNKQTPHIGKIGIVSSDCSFNVTEIKFEDSNALIPFGLEKLQLVEESTPKLKIGDKVKLTNSIKHGKLHRNIIYSIKKIEKNPVINEFTYLLHSDYKDKNGLRPSYSALESDIELVKMKEKQETKLKVKIPVDGILMYYSDNKYLEEIEEKQVENVSLNKEQSIYSNLFVSYNPHSYRLGLNCNNY